MGWTPGPFPTSGNDQYTGTAGNDGSSSNPVIGGGGDDTLSGLAGNDVLAGDIGADILFGGVGNDLLDGGDGNDQITDEDGDDKIWGGGGDDIIVHGEVANTSLNKSFYIDAGSGNDFVHLNWRFFDYNDAHIDGGLGIDALELQDSNPSQGKNLSRMDQVGFEILYTGGTAIEVYASTLEAFDTIRYSATNSTTRAVFKLYQHGDLDLSDELGSQPVQITDEDDYVDSRIIRTGAGDDIIYAGRDADTIYGDLGDDKIAAYGGGSQLFGEDGNDELSGRGALFGGIGDDKLSSGDHEYGGDGDDKLYATLNPAVFDGGQGDDTLFFWSVRNSNYNNDLRGAALYLLEHVSFGAKADAAAVSVAQIFASQIGSGISSNASIEGYKDATLQITMGGLNATDLSGFTRGGDLDSKPKILVTGDGDAETITGSIFADTIFGNGGADVLAGGWGVDALYGGDGDDQISSSGQDGNAGGEIYDGGAGTDVLIATGGAYTVDFSNDNLFNFEELRFTNPGALATGTVKVTADQLVNIHTVTGIVPTTAGDVLQIAMGARTSLNLSPTGGTVINNFSGKSDFIVINGDGDNESIIGSVFKDTIYGGAGSDFLDPGAGLDRVYGGDANDTIHTMAGDILAGEVFDGGAGIDTLIIDTPLNDGFNVDLGLNQLKSIDQLIFAFTNPGEFSSIHLLASQIGPGLTGAATVWGDQQDDTTEILVVAAGDQKSVDMSGLVFQGFGGGDYVLILGDDDGETITGTAVSDAIFGGGGADKLNGGLGADSLVGGGGNDTYIVDALDTVSEEAGGGVDTVQAAFSYTLGDNLENLTLTGAADVAGTGNALANHIIANAGANSLYGLDGADTIDGKAGDDVIDGGAGKDKLTGGTGHDLFVFSVAPSAANADTIADFKPVDDTIGLSMALFGAIGASVDVGELKIGTTAATIKAADSNDFLLYNKATGQLYYDADANGSGAAQLIATLTGKPALTEADFHMV